MSLTVSDDSVRDWLTRLEEEDKLAPEVIVAEAADPGHIGHALFNWDDTSAAHLYRLWQARDLVARYTVTIETGTGRQIRTRLWTNLRSEGRYVRTDRAADDAEWRSEMIEDAKRAARHFTQKFKLLGDDVLLALLREVIEANE